MVLFFIRPSLAKYTQLASVNSEEQFRSLLSSEEYEFRYDCGISKPSGRIPFSDKVKVVEAMSLHCCVLASLAELEQLRRGLAMQKFSTLMEAFPEIVRKAFNPPERKISSSFIQDLFVPRLSPVGSNKREVEEAVLIIWIRYLQKLEGIAMSLYYIACMHQPGKVHYCGGAV